MATLRQGIPLIEETLVLSAARTFIEPPSERLVANAPVAAIPPPTPTPEATPTPTVSPTLAPPPPLDSGELTPLPFLTPEVAVAPPPVFDDTSAAAGQVSMQVLSANRQGDQVVLAVSLSNSSDRVVRFLYSFMNVTDDRGRPVSASTQGLPGELPPNGQSYQGTITIPAIFLQGSSTVSLNLPDYPSQNFRLQVSGIPIQ
ncbi:MAG: hypothetical protein HC926_02300 [Synechococcaceae cyanobacterium SM2_3_60]|nr:hypothetical protein [Synechococcaceae cyanobacterium SM2_3_60]